MLVAAFHKGGVVGRKAQKWFVKASGGARDAPECLRVIPQGCRNWEWSNQPEYVSSAVAL